MLPRDSSDNSIVVTDVNIGGSALGIIWFLVSLAIIVVAARLYTQIRIIRQAGWSEYLAIMSVVIVTIFASLITIQHQYGWGRHQRFIDDETIQHFLRYNWACQPFGIMGSTFGRLSFIVLMFRLFGTRKWMCRLLWTLFVLQLVTNLGTVIMVYAQCKDPRALYDFSIPKQCLPDYVQTYLGYGHSTFNGVTDLVLTAIPATMLWDVQMARRLKIGLSALLGLSCVAFVGTVMKIVYLDALSNQADFTYETVPMFTWIVAEAVLVVVAASVPLLRPLVKHLSGNSTTSQSYDMPPYSRKTIQPHSGQFSKLYDSHGHMQDHSIDETASKNDTLPPESPFAEERDAGILVKHSYVVQYMAA